MFFLWTIDSTQFAVFSFQNAMNLEITEINIAFISFLIRLSVILQWNLNKMVFNESEMFNTNTKF